MMVIVAVY